MKTISEYLALPYTKTVRWDNESDLFVARVKEVPQCSGHGDTESEALLMLSDNFEVWLDACIEARRVIPVPEPVEELPSGKWLQRVPRSLHKRIVECAEREGVSLNTYVATTLATAVGAVDSALDRKIDLNAVAVANPSLEGRTVVAGKANFGYHFISADQCFQPKTKSPWAIYCLDLSQQKSAARIATSRPISDFLEMQIKPYEAFVDTIAEQFSSGIIRSGRSNFEKDEKHKEDRIYA